MRSAAAFRTGERSLKLPHSRQTVRYREINVIAMIMREGKAAPGPLTASMLQNINGQEPTPATADDLPDVYGFMRKVITRALVWPQVVDAEPDYEAGQILFDDLHWRDMLRLLNTLMGTGDEETDEAAGFLAGQNGRVDAVPAGERLAQEAE